MTSFKVGDRVINKLYPNHIAIVTRVYGENHATHPNSIVKIKYITKYPPKSGDHLEQIKWLEQVFTPFKLWKELNAS